MSMDMARQLKDDERSLLAGLIAEGPQAYHLIGSLDDALVKEMDDGGMGGSRFREAGGKVRRFWKQLVERKLADIDGVPVIVAVINGRLNIARV